MLRDHSKFLISQVFLAVLQDQSVTESESHQEESHAAVRRTTTIRWMIVDKDGDRFRRRPRRAAKRGESLRTAPHCDVRTRRQDKIRLGAPQ